MGRSAGPSNGRVFFPGSPWSAGHRIVELAWAGSFTSNGELRFHFKIVSANYDEEAPPERNNGVDAELDPDPWRSCFHEMEFFLYTEGDGGGFVVGTEGKPLSFDRLAGRDFLVDPLPIDPNEPRAFIAHVSDPEAHDTVADHRIRFVERLGPFEFSIQWRARVALLLSDDFDHALELKIHRATFEGFNGIPYSLEDPDRIQRALRCLAEPERFLVTPHGCYRSIVPEP